MLNTNITESLYYFTVRRTKSVKFLAKVITQISAKALSKLTKFEIPPEFSLAHYQMLYGTYEMGTVSLCKKLLRPGMTVVDIGAHMGYYTSIFAKLVGLSGKVYAFEPHPENYEFLKRNVRKFKNVLPTQMAVTNIDGKTALYESSIGSGRHSLIASTGPYIKKIHVQGASLDKFLSGTEVNLVKVDVEGAELEVLSGSRQLVKHSKDLQMIVEFSPAALRSRGIEPCKLIESLKESDFKIYAIEETRNRLLHMLVKETSNDQLKTLLSRRKYINLYCQKGGTEVPT